MLFGEFTRRPHGYAALDTEAYFNPLFDARFTMRSPFLDPLVGQALVDNLHRRERWAWSHGGYFEVRRHLWRGGYMAKEEKYLHLGVDFNVPAFTPVYATRRMQVVRVDDDHPEEGGWGPRLIAHVWEADALLIYAHLLPEGRPDFGAIVKPGEMLGRVGTIYRNGGWFAHLHVQAMTAEAGRYFKERLHELDGYGDPVDSHRLGRLFPHPFHYLGDWEGVFGRRS